MVFIIFILAFFLRCINLNQSLWLDEATTAKVVTRFSYPGIITSFSPYDFHPPLYYLFMKAWTGVFGTSEISLRMPSVIAALTAGYFVYLIGRKLVNESGGVWASALFLFNPLIMYYSQEARMYMIVTALLSGALYCYITLFGKKSARHVVTLNILLGVSFAFFYGSVFLVVAMAAYLVKRGRTKSAVLILLGFIVSALLLSPLLFNQYLHARVALQLAPNWKSVLGSVNVKNLFLIPLKFTIGRIQFMPKIAYYATAGTAAALMSTAVFLGARREKALGWLIALTLSFGVICSFFTPLLQYFRFLYLLPAVAVLIAGVRIPLLKQITAALFLTCSLVYLLMPQFHREDWKGVLSLLPHRAAVYMIPFSSDPLLYYRPDLQVHDLRKAAAGREVIVFPYTADIYGVHPESDLLKAGYRRGKIISSRGIEAQFWTR